MTDVIGLGEVIVDMIATQPEAGLAGTPGFLKFPGGAVANVMAGVARLGGSSAMLTSFAGDAFGRWLREEMQRAGVDISRAETAAHPARTPAGFIAIAPDGGKDVQFYRHADWEHFPSPAIAAPENMQGGLFFHFGIVCLLNDAKAKTTLAALRCAKNCGLLVSFDPNYRPHAWPSRRTAMERFEQAIDFVDVLKISDEEWPLLSRREEPAAEAGEFFRAGVKLLVVSRGERGATLMTRRHRVEIPAFPCRCVETTGAGDAFMAALLVQLCAELREGRRPESLNESQLRRIGRFACAAGALATTKPGAFSAMPTLANVKNFSSNSDIVPTDGS